MELALAEAKIAYDKDEVPIGAVMVRDDEVIARSHNLKEELNDPTAHAEMLAIRQATEKLGGWRLTDCTLYVTIEPCPMCAGALVQSRVDQLIYGAKDPKAGAAGSIINIVDSPDFNHQLKIKLGILEDKCSNIMKSFFRNLRN
ncbi:tRNA(adenine34) deaminase [Selenihalanaerobacter shriftii]|uniref:tRNA-specific adenosine deaminase n=2 Tax=Selenihalanaerobacter shriftii TaxID=142842 RepID=A0A1T4QQI7_9FIRM|nr:tRNA(adenine34) deaminase [Selenihalanaerobacter shriftii]